MSTRHHLFVLDEPFAAERTDAREAVVAELELVLSRVLAPFRLQAPAHTRKRGMSTSERRSRDRRRGL